MTARGPGQAPRRCVVVAAAILGGLLLTAPAVHAEVGSRSSPSALAAARQFLCPYGGQPQPGRRGRCGGGGGNAIGWMAGLPKATQSQAACPPDTIAVAARSRAESVRCLPE